LSCLTTFQEKVPQGESTFTFVTDGVESAIKQAKTAAGDKNVYVVGGANVARSASRLGCLMKCGFTWCMFFLAAVSVCLIIWAPSRMSWSERRS